MDFYNAQAAGDSATMRPPDPRLLPALHRAAQPGRGLRGVHREGRGDDRRPHGRAGAPAAVRAQARRSSTRSPRSSPSSARSKRPRKASLMFKNLIDGEWVDGVRASRNVNPSDTGDLVGEYAQADAAQTRAAIESARRAFPAWSLEHAAAALRHPRRGRHRDPGAPRRARRPAGARGRQDAARGASARCTRAGNIFKFFAGEALRLGRRDDAVGAARASASRSRASRSAWWASSRRGISPSRFPRGRSRRRWPTATAWSSSRPSSVPGSAWALAEIIVAQRPAAGRVQPRDGHAAPWWATRCVDTPTSTPSPSPVRSATGQRDRRRPCVARMAKFQLEMGGKNPHGRAGRRGPRRGRRSARCNSAFFSTGQRCTASSRAHRHRGHPRPLRRRARRRACKTLKVDDALQGRHRHRPGRRPDAARTGPRLHRHRAAGKARKLAFGGEAIERARRRRLLHAPALFTEATPACASTARRCSARWRASSACKDYDEALAMANDTPFGLAAGIATTSLKHATHFKRHARPAW